MSAAVWFVAMERPGSRAEWDCATLGPPDATDLLPTRRPSSGDFSRHIPRRAHAATTGTTIELESGLEHDLLRWLDQRADVTWLVAQPVRFHFPATGLRRAVAHTPDLLSQHADGSVALWDARPTERRTDDFLFKAAMTAEACRRVGWSHEVFSGLPTATRLNLLWLNGYRRPMPWHPEWCREIESLLRLRPWTLGELRARDDGSGELVATLWHLIASGKIECDLAAPIREPSVLAWREDYPPISEDGRRASAAPAVLDAIRTGDVLLSTRLRRAQL